MSIVLWIKRLLILGVLGGLVMLGLATMMSTFWAAVLAGGTTLGVFTLIVVRAQRARHLDHGGDALDATGEVLEAVVDAAGDAVVDAVGEAVDVIDV